MREQMPSRLMSSACVEKRSGCSKPSSRMRSSEWSNKHTQYIGGHTSRLDLLRTVAYYLLYLQEIQFALGLYRPVTIVKLYHRQKG